MELLFARYAGLALLASSANPSIASEVSSELPAPSGLVPCSASDPAAAAVSAIATKLGGEFLGCFLSPTKVATPTTADARSSPVEHAIAIGLHGNAYTLNDLSQQLFKVRDQWKTFDPLDKQSRDKYIARLNDLLANSNAKNVTKIASVSPVLVSIDQLDSSYYLVTSLRTYTVGADTGRTTFTQVNSDAVVLRHSRLIRLTIQRTLHDPADVAQVQTEITKWAQAIARS